MGGGLAGVKEEPAAAGRWLAGEVPHYVSKGSGWGGVTPECNDAIVTPGVKLIFLLNMCLIIIISFFFQLPL